MEPEIKEETEKLGEPIYVEMNAVVHGKGDVN